MGMRKILFDMDKKIAVIGGNGYLGYHVAKYFKADSLSRANGFDVTEKGLGKKLSGYDVIIHMAAKVDKSGKNDMEVFRVNADGTRNIVESLNKNQTLIFASTKEVYTPINNQDSYGLSKIIAENYINYFSKVNGFKSGIFRLATTYAPATNGSTFVNYFVDCVKNNKKLLLMMKGEQTRDFLYVDDLSNAFEKFIYSDKKKGMWDIGGGKENSENFATFLNDVGKVVGVSPVIGFSDEVVAGNPHHITDIEKIGKDLGWAPKVGILEGIAKII